MAFKKGQSGNPGGRRVEKLVADAIRLAANEIDEATGKKKLRVAAEKIVDKAVQGDLAAFNTIADRLDGKPVQDTNLSVTDDRPLGELTFAELMRRTDETLSRIEAAANGTGGADASEERPPDLHKLN